MCFNFDHYFVEFDKFIQSNVQIWYRSGLASVSGILQFIVLAISGSTNSCFYFQTDPFLATVDDDGGSAGGNFIHIRIQQRNGRKTLTTVQGIHADYDLKKIVKACKKVRSCDVNGM